MARTKSLLALAYDGSRKSSNNKKDALGSAHVETKSSEIAKSPEEELLRLLSNLPEESDSERELSFSFLVNNQSSLKCAENKDAANENSSKTDQESRKLKPETIEKMKRRRSSCGGNGDGVLLNLFVSTSITRSNSTRKDRRRSTQFTLAELEKRDTDLTRGFGCWSALLVGRRRRTIQANAV